MKALFPRTGAERAGLSPSKRPDDEQLRKRVRTLLESGALPRNRPKRTWGGPGSGSKCPACGATVAADEVEMELEFAGDDGSMPVFVHMHLACFAALEREARNLAPGNPPRIDVPASQSRPAGPAARNGGPNGSSFLDGG